MSRRPPPSLLASVHGERLGIRSTSAHALVASRLAASYAQLPHAWDLGGDGSGYISDIAFDDSGELVASCSTDGRLVVHQLQQFACAAPAAELSSAEAADAWLEAAAAEAEEADDKADAAFAAGGAALRRDPPSVSTLSAAAARAAAARAASRVEESKSCAPLFSVSTRLAARAARWSPANPNEIIVAFHNSHEVRAYDLASSNPATPSRILRSSKHYQPSHGLADLAL